MWSDGIWVVWGMEHLMVLITHKYLDSPRLWEGLQPTSILLDWFYSIRTHLFFNSRWLWAWLLSEQTDHKELAVKESKVKQGEEMVKSLQPYMVQLYLVQPYLVHRLVMAQSFHFSQQHLVLCGACLNFLESWTSQCPWPHSTMRRHKIFWISNWIHMACCLISYDSGHIWPY